MIIGKVSDFAIEAEAIRAQGKWFYGHLRFWVAGKDLGDFADTSDLAGSARWGRRFLAASARRTRPDLDAQETGTIYRLLFARFFERGGSCDGETFDRDPYVIDDVGESSLRDRVSMLVVRRKDGCDRVIVHEYHSPKTWEVVLPLGLVDDVMERYCSWVDAERQK